MADLIENEPIALLDTELLALSLRVKDEVTNHNARGLTQVPFPSWAVICIKELSPESHEFSPSGIFLSPFGKKTATTKFDEYSTLDAEDIEKDSTFGDRAVQAMNRISRKVKGKRYTYFSHYDDDHPWLCVP